MKKADILILGAGLSGLTLNYLLRNSGLDVRIVESRDRIGGRILTNYKEAAPPVEMGATWLGRKHSSLFSLLQELDLDIFPQELGGKAIYEAISTSPFQLVTLPPNNDPSFRIKGGSSTLINALAKYTQPEDLFLGQIVKSIQIGKDGCAVNTYQETFHARFVVTTIPPFLLKRTVDFHPELPSDLSEVMTSTHTWMGESIKFGLVYSAPFWREKDTSGTVVSNVGPIPEMYDHSNFEDDSHAIKGFINPSFFPLSREERLNRILQQLEKYYGPVVHQYVDYQELVWSSEQFTYVPYEKHIMPHQHNGHPVYRKGYFNDRLFISGSETAASFPGYMDGAVESARWVFEKIKKVT